MISAAVFVLKRLDRLGLRGLVLSVLRILAFFGASQTRIRSLCRRTLSDDAPVRAWQSRLYDAQGRRVGAIPTRDKAPVHLIVEPGAGLPKWLPSLLGRSVTVHGFEGVDDHIRAAGLEGRVQRAMLRDRFDDLSDAGRRLHEEAEIEAAAIIEGWVSDRDDRLSEALIFALAERMATRRVLMECLVTAVDAAQDEAVVLVCCDEDDFVRPGWSRLSRGRASDTLFVHHSSTTQQEANAFGASLADILQGQVRAPALDLSGIDWTRLQDIAAQSGRELGARIGEGLAENSALLLHASNLKAYQETFAGLSDALASPNGCAIFDGFKTLSDDYLHVAGPPQRVPGLHASSLMGAPIRWLVERGAWDVLTAYHAGCALSQKSSVSLAFATTTRHYHLRALAAGLVDGGTLVMDIQSLNLLDHPKYKPPVATHLALIDAASHAVHARRFGTLDLDMRLTGSVLGDRRREQVRALDPVSVHRRLGVPGGAEVVTLFSQLQPMSRMIRVASTMMAVLDTPDRCMIIRLHPREGAARVRQYEDALRDIPGFDRLIIMQGGTLQDVLCISRASVTFYSNTARDAAQLGLPVISAEFDGWDLPVSLSRQGLSLLACNEAELVAHLRDVLDGRGTSARYFTENPHFETGWAVSHILDYARDILGR